MLCDITVHGIVDAMRKQHSRSTLGCRLRVLELDDGMIGDKGKRQTPFLPPEGLPSVAVAIAFV